MKASNTFLLISICMALVDFPTLKVFLLVFLSVIVFQEHLHISRITSFSLCLLMGEYNSSSLLQLPIYLHSYLPSYLTISTYLFLYLFYWIDTFFCVSFFLPFFTCSEVKDSIYFSFSFGICLNDFSAKANLRLISIFIIQLNKTNEK